MRGILYYFSGTGNTKWIADKFRKVFYMKNVMVDLYNLEDKDEIDFNEYDFIIIGTPIYADAHPKLVDDFIKSLPILKNKMKVIIYSTQAAKKTAGVGIMKEELQIKGYEVVIEAMFQMKNNYYFQVGKKTDKEIFSQILINNIKQVNEIVEKFLKGVNVNIRTSVVRKSVAKISSKGFKKFLPHMCKNLKVTEDCIKCGLCVRNCPKGNIIFEDGETIVRNNCMLCLRCIHLCPVNAITYKGKKIEQTQKDIIKCLDIK